MWSVYRHTVSNSRPLKMPHKTLSRRYFAEIFSLFPDCNVERMKRKRAAIVVFGAGDKISSFDNGKKYRKRAVEQFLKIDYRLYIVVIDIDFVNHFDNTVAPFLYFLTFEQIPNCL